MPPATIALISEPIITFQATEPSIAATASNTSIVSQIVASSPPNSFGRANRNNPLSTRVLTVSSGNLLRF